MQAAFAGFVGGVTLLTVYRYLHNPDPATRCFLGVCIAAQLCALSGMAARAAPLIRVGHVTFTLAMWVGTSALHGFELRMVAALAAFTWLTRRLLGYCLFAHARGATTTDDPAYDALYALPLFIALSRIPYA